MAALAVAEAHALELGKDERRRRGLRLAAARNEYECWVKLTPNTYGAWPHLEEWANLAWQPGSREYILSNGLWLAARAHNVPMICKCLDVHIAVLTEPRFSPLVAVLTAQSTLSRLPGRFYGTRADKSTARALVEFTSRGYTMTLACLAKSLTCISNYNLHESLRIAIAACPHLTALPHPPAPELVRLRNHVFVALNRLLIQALNRRQGEIGRVVLDCLSNCPTVLTTESTQAIVGYCCPHRSMDMLTLGLSMGAPVAPSALHHLVTRDTWFVPTKRDHFNLQATALLLDQGVDPWSRDSTGRPFIMCDAQAWAVPELLRRPTVSASAASAAPDLLCTTRLVTHVTNGPAKMTLHSTVHVIGDSPMQYVFDRVKMEKRIGALSPSLLVDLIVLGLPLDDLDIARAVMRGATLATVWIMAGGTVSFSLAEAFNSCWLEELADAGAVARAANPAAVAEYMAHGVIDLTFFKNLFDVTDPVLHAAKRIKLRRHPFGSRFRIMDHEWASPVIREGKGWNDWAVLQLQEFCRPAVTAKFAQARAELTAAGMPCSRPSCLTEQLAKQTLVRRLACAVLRE